MTRYVGLIDGEAGGYGIVFPASAGCTSTGATIEAAIGNGADAMRLWVDMCEERGGTVPVSRAFEALRGDADVQLSSREAATVVLVPLVRVTGRSVKANLSIDEGVLAAIDEEAARCKLTRVGFIEVMAREMLPEMARRGAYPSMDSSRPRRYPQAKRSGEADAVQPPRRTSRLV